MRMFVFRCSHVPLLAVCLWSFSCSGRLAATSRTARRQAKDKEQLHPDVRDWGDYSDLPGMELGLGLDHDEEREKGRRVEEPSSSLSPEQDFLAEFAGKKRLWVITAPSRNDHYLRMMEKQLEDMEQAGLNCRLAERDTFIVTIIQNAMMEGRIQKTTFQGDATVESLDHDTVSKLLHYLELTNQEQAFSMVILKKNLRVSEHFPYPVRVEAVLEVIDQFPMRKLEKMTRKVSPFKCKPTKKKVLVKRKKIKKKTSLISQGQGNHTALVPLPRPMLDKKAAIKSKIQDILNGRSRFVIRKKPTAESPGEVDSKRTSNTAEKKKTSSVLDVEPKSSEEVKTNRFDSSVGETKRKHHGKGVQEKPEEPSKTDVEKSSSKKKGKRKKGKKGKGRGKKSNSEISEKDRTALKELVESLKGKRRLMVISTPSNEAPLYAQQKEDIEKRHCDYAVRKITMATIIGSGHDATLSLQHLQLDSEPPFRDLPDKYSDPVLVSLLRAELGLSSSDLFSMTVTDYDLKPNRVHEAPLLSFALFDLIDNFPSRGPEKEKEKKDVSVCSEGQPQSGEHNSLLRFMLKRRLLLISTPSEDDYSFQQQLSALTGQECPMGIRHFALLKLVGSGTIATGSVELFPLNGRSQSEVEPLSGDVVNSMRGQLKVSKDYFSMVVVEKDGDVKAWFPSPMWTLDNVYDLVDSTEQRHQEESLQRSLGIRCPDDRGTGASQHGYDGENTDGGYLYRRAEE